MVALQVKDLPMIIPKLLIIRELTTHNLTRVLVMKDQTLITRKLHLRIPFPN